MDDKIISYCRFCQEGEDPEKRVVIKTDEGYECGLSKGYNNCTILELYRRISTVSSVARRTPFRLMRH